MNTSSDNGHDKSPEAADVNDSKHDNDFAFDYDNWSKHIDLQASKIADDPQGWLKRETQRGAMERLPRWARRAAENTKTGRAIASEDAEDHWLSGVDKNDK